MQFHILSYALLESPFIVHVSGNRQKPKSIWNFFLNNFFLLISKIDKNSQSLIKIWPKTVLFRNIALIFSLEKPCYLENRVVREPCKQRSACTCTHPVSLATLASSRVCSDAANCFRLNLLLRTSKCSCFDFHVSQRRCQRKLGTSCLFI